MSSPLERLRLQLDVLFQSDAEGRLLAVNEPGQPPAPRVFLGRTPEGNLWRVNAGLSAETRRTLESLCAGEPVSAALEPAPRCADALRGTLEADAPVTAVFRGPAFHFPDDFAYPTSAEQIDASRPASVAALHPHFPELARDVRDVEPCLAVIQDDVAISAAFSARSSALASECGVVTAPAHRGRGHAVSVVAAWAEATRRMGHSPLYSTEWSNAASRRVSEKLGLVLYGEDFHLR